MQTRSYVCFVSCSILCCMGAVAFELFHYLRRVGGGSGGTLGVRGGPGGHPDDLGGLRKMKTDTEQ